MALQRGLVGRLADGDDVRARSLVDVGRPWTDNLRHGSRVRVHARGLTCADES
jgi:hypothetical protein